MNSADIQLGTYQPWIEHKDKDPKIKVGNHVRISKYKNVFGKGYT